MKHRRRSPRRSLAPWLPLLLPLLFFASDRTGAYTPSVHGDGQIPVWDTRTYAANIVNGRVTWHTFAAGTDDVLDNVWGHDEFEAIRRSFATWENVPTSTLRFAEDTVHQAYRHNTQDRVNLVMFVEEELDPFVLGVTFPYMENGRLVDCDILLNDEYEWSTSTPGRSNRPDVQSVMTHEIGHFLGLDHSPLGQATMYYSYAPGAISSRSLTEDDIAGITTLYPTTHVDSLYGRISGRVDVDGTTNERGVQVVALDVATSQPFSSALSRADGTYEILVRPGFYRLLATPARPNSSLNPWWGSADDKIAPGGLTVEGTMTGSAIVVRVDAGETTSVADIFVDRVSDPHENDDRSSRATPIRIGDLIGARFEKAKNEDWYSFEGQAGDVITISVHAEQIGSGGDPELHLFDTDATNVIAKNLDIRASLFPDNKFGDAGVDVDCLIENFALPRTGRFYVRVRPAGHSDTGSKSDYYVLLVSSGKDAPSRHTTEVTVLPDRMKADGVSRSLITVIPNKVTGERLGSGLFVEITHDGVGHLGGVIDMSDGTYTAVMTAPDDPGADEIDVVVRGGGGSLDLRDVRRLVYVGPPHGATSTVTASPRRLPADGTSVGTITVVPRDANGEVVGTDVTVAFEFVGAPAGTIGDVVGNVDGSYSAPLTAATTPGEVRIRAVMNGSIVTEPVRVAFGFELESVTRDLLNEVAALAVDESLSSSARSKLESAWSKLRRADGRLRDPRLLVPDVYRAAKDLSKAIKSIVKARGKADDDSLAPVTEDLLEALRRVVDDEALPTGPARERYLRGVTAAGEGDLAGAAKHHYKAYKLAAGERPREQVRAAEVVLERDGSTVTLVARFASGKISSARLVGPESAKLSSDGKQDGNRIYAREIDSPAVGTYDLVIEPKGDGLPSTTPFTVDGTTPSATQILAPASGATGVSLTPTIRWTAVPEAARYGVVVTRTDGSVVFAETVLGGGATEVTVPASLGLSAGGKWRVEVRVVGDDGDRVVVEVSFRT